MCWLSVSSVRIECLQRRLMLLVAARYRSSFSILCSDRVSATPPPVRLSTVFGSLSVSSVRIECLQQRSGFRRTALNQRFQYPLFGSSVCNSMGECWGHSTPRTFSILCSDRVSATINVASSATGQAFNFQYPLFGSSVCNSPPWATRSSPASLSVSSVRIECLQLCLLALSTMMKTFLSVSSVRIECLQQGKPEGFVGVGFGFQYPLFGSSVCNWWTR